MNLTKTVLLVGAIGAGVILLLFSNNINHPVLNKSTEEVQNSITEKWESKTDDQANITVTVTPSFSSPDSKEWKFDVVMNTHSVELDQDMTKIAVLVDEQGKEYKPIGWDGQVGGHHREGVVVFNQVTPTPKSIEMKISGVGDVVRSFVWQLK